MVVAALTIWAGAQTSGKAVRHHKGEVDDPSSPPELIRAESAIEKQDYTTAEPLLKKVVASDPANYAAWFDLGFLYNALGIPLAALGFMSPVLCAAAMGLSDLVVIGNALRLRRWKTGRKIANLKFSH